MPFDIEKAPWFVPQQRPLPPGRLTPNPLVIPIDDVDAILRDTVPAVAGVPRDDSGVVVWQQEDSELAVFTEVVVLTADDGFVTVHLSVLCDQIVDRSIASVRFALGRRDRPAGLVMACTARPDGPDVVVDVWADALVAFAFEVLVDVTNVVSGHVGRDTAGRALIAGSVAAAPGQLLLHPMARHVIEWSR